MKELLNKLPPWLQNFEFERYLSDNYVVLDFETTTIDKGSPYESDNRIVCSSWSVGPAHNDFNSGRGTRVQVGNEFEQSDLLEAIESADFWVAHNSKFEYGWLQRCGLPLDKSLAFCTQLAEYCILSNRGKPNWLGLDKCLKRRGWKGKDDLGKKLMVGGVCPSLWPTRWLKRYAKQDVDKTERLFLDQRKHLIKHKQLGLVFTRNILTPVLVDIEPRGMFLDEERVKILYHRYTKELRKLEDKISTLTDGANPNSPPQMREVLYEKLKFPKPTDKKWLGKNGDPTTSFDYIATLKTKTKKQEEFKKIKQEHSKVNAALTKGLNKFYDCVSETEAKILTANFNQTITVTQRLSSTGKNYKAQLQNLARIFKPLFAARRKGWKIAEIDEGQLEYRTAVWYGQDEAGVQDIKNKVDAHSYTASIIFEGKWEHLERKSAPWEHMRFLAKAHTFKPLYGGKSGSKSEVKYYTAFMDKHKGIAKAQNEWKAAAVNTGEVRIPTGLVFYFPGTRILEDGYITNSTNICNYPVQSLATADIVPVGVVYQWHLMRVANLQSYLINTVHDSSVGEVHPDEEEIYTEIGEYCFTEVVYTYLDKVYGIDFNVPLEAETKIKTNWSDTESWREKYLQ